MQKVCNSDLSSYQCARHVAQSHAHQPALNVLQCSMQRTLASCELNCATAPRAICNQYLADLATHQQLPEGLRSEQIRHISPLCRICPKACKRFERSCRASSAVSQRGLSRLHPQSIFCARVCTQSNAAMQASSCACGSRACLSAPQCFARRCSSVQPPTPAWQPAQQRRHRHMRCRAAQDSDSDSSDGVDWEEKWSRFQAGIKDKTPEVEAGSRGGGPRPTGNSRQDQIRRQENAVLDAWNQVHCTADANMVVYSEELFLLCCRMWARMRESCSEHAFCAAAGELLQVRGRRGGGAPTSAGAQRAAVRLWDWASRF